MITDSHPLGKGNTFPSSFLSLSVPNSVFRLSKAFLILKSCFKSRIKQVGPHKFWKELSYTVLHIAFFWHFGVRVISEGSSEATQSSPWLKAGSQGWVWAMLLRVLQLYFIDLWKDGDLTESLGNFFRCLILNLCLLNNNYYHANNNIIVM